MQLARLRATIKRGGWTYKRLGHRVRLHYSAVSEIVNGRRTATQAEQHRIARLLDADPQWLFDPNPLVPPPYRSCRARAAIDQALKAVPDGNQ